MRLLLSRVFGFVSAVLVAGQVAAFTLPGGSTNPDTARWQNTASGPTGSAGDSITLTWSIVPDGTSTLDLGPNNSRSPSNLIASLDAEFGAGPGGTDYTQRPWFTYLQQSFDRWEAVSGVDYVYEPSDDGAQHGPLFAGQLGVRGDVRVGGVGIDGDLNGLAYNFFATNGGDLAFDTDDVDNYFGDPAQDFLNFRYTTAHELGHGLGLDHSASVDAEFLMEANPQPGIDGPQHDDLRGVHWLYGDALEKTNGGAGNDTAANALHLGSLVTGAPLAVGTSGDGVSVAPGETDFVSIDRASDVDFFAFSVAAPTTVDVILTPRGAQFSQSGTPFDTTTTGDVSLTVIDTDGVTVVAAAAAQPAGAVESLLSLQLDSAGDYYVRVGGTGAVTQFYQVDVLALPILPGDYNLDGFVNASDYTVYRDSDGQSVAAYSGADGDGDGLVGPGDLAVWSSNLGRSLPGPAAAVPEPAAAGLLAAGLGLLRRPARLF